MEESNGNFPWWIKVYSENEIPEDGKSKGEYFVKSPKPGEGFIFYNGLCEPTYKDSTFTAIDNLEKIGGGLVKVALCSGRIYLNKDD